MVYSLKVWQPMAESLFTKLVLTRMLNLNLIIIIVSLQSEPARLKKNIAVSG